jgi:hypothetical protein
MKLLLLLIPFISSICAAAGCGFFYRACVSVSCAVIVRLTSKSATDRSTWWVIAALLISAAADWFMVHSNRNPAYFLYGVGLFFTAHTGFLLFCLQNGRIHRYLLLTLLAGYLTFFFVMLRPAIADSLLLTAVLAYLLISCFSLAAAAGLRLAPVVRWCFTAGIALLVFSDTIIALRVFAGYRGMAFLILIQPAYFASQMMITLALMKR